MKLKEIIKKVEDKKVLDFFNYEIEGIAYDSRKIKENYIFVAIKGTNLDGHSFIKDAIDRGAKVIIVEKKDLLVPKGITTILVKDTRKVLGLISSTFYDEPSKKLKVVGITGTNGKTTVSYFIKAVLSDPKNKNSCGLIGTISYQVGERSISSINTTPESLDIQHLIYEMVEEKCKYAIMEVSSHGLSYGRVNFVQFDCAIFTNISPHEHLDYHKKFRNYLKAKLSLFNKYLKESEKDGKVGIINIDDPYSKYFIKALKYNNIKYITYGKNKKADIKLIDFKIKEEGNFFKIDIEGKEEEFATKLKGKGNVYNAIAAISYALYEKVPIDEIKSRLWEMESVPGRFEFIKEGQPFDVIIDYAHTHYALWNLLSSVKEFNRGKIIVVFGCGGDRDKSKRPLMGEIASKMADTVIITSDNPRSEDPAQIIKDVEKGIPKRYKKKCFSFVDRKEAIKFAISLAKEKDCVVIAGKGHETYQILKNTVVPFSDKEEARKAIKMTTN